MSDSNTVVITFQSRVRGGWSDVWPQRKAEQVTVTVAEAAEIIRASRAMKAQRMAAAPTHCGCYNDPETPCFYHAAKVGDRFVHCVSGTMYQLAECGWIGPDGEVAR